MKIEYCKTCKVKKAIRMKHGKYICSECAARHPDIRDNLQRPRALNKKKVAMSMTADRIYSKKYGMPKKEKD